MEFKHSAADFARSLGFEGREDLGSVGQALSAKLVTTVNPKEISVSRVTEVIETMAKEDPKVLRFIAFGCAREFTAAMLKLKSRQKGWKRKAKRR